MNRKTILAAAGLLVLAVLPLAYQNPYVLHLLIMTLLWVLLGQAWNLLGGFTGQISYGHAAFFGVGAYTTGILVKSGLSPATAWSGLLLGGLMAALV
ncbi:MAG TPA: branched-chain amino acid ABC transporter permease, partial [Thermoanaerobaculia bacterium]|nr:branched-chain amino acid ABC transporter permease [Thermoanaerobaculia bacterium]